MDPKDFPPIGVVNGKVVIELDRELTKDERTWLRNALDHTFGFDNCMVLMPGARLAREDHGPLTQALLDQTAAIEANTALLREIHLQLQNR